MDSIALYFGTALVALAGISITSLIALKAFSGWLDLKRAELAGHRDANPPSAVARIDIADLKERIRKLEAIAAGVDI